jgi:putative ABC transport system permease protein
MFFKILRKDLKRKKAMNVILFIFLFVASMLIAGSVNMLYTTITALDTFKKESNVADNILFTYANETWDKQIKDWANTSELVKDLQEETYVFFLTKNITIPESHGELEYETTLVLGKLPKKNNLVFNQDNEFFTLQTGEVAIPISMKEQTKLRIGDKITIDINGYKKDFTIKYYIKDAMLGSSLMSLKRVLISDGDYNEYRNQPGLLYMKFWSIMKESNFSYDDVEKDFGKTSIPTVSIINSNTVTFTYTMDTVITAIMLIVSIFLIFIAFLILRFTITFTIYEDFKEIGIMKAIGIRNLGIKKIYLVKYFCLAITGGFFGFLASIPFSKFLLLSISNHIMIKITGVNQILALLSVCFIVLITVVFCYFCTRKINFLSVIDAIRQGKTGERFTSAGRIKLHKYTFLSTPLFMSLSDILNGFKRFVILIITFVLGTAIIIIPINAINTLSDSSVLKLFGFGQIDFVISNEEIFQNALNNQRDEFFENISIVEDKINEVGFKSTIYPEVQQMVTLYGENESDIKSAIGMKGYNFTTENYNYLSGTAPKLANEIALTEVLTNYFNVEVGDSIVCQVREKKDTFIVTGIFQAMMNMGSVVRFSDDYDLTIEGLNGFSLFGVFHDNTIDKDNAINKLVKAYPEYEIVSGKEFAKDFLGSITEQFSTIKNMIIIIVLGINFLITTLLVRMLLTREISEVALLKSIGFRDSNIKRWQIIRITIILVISVILGTILANQAGSFLTSGIFKMMGATEISLIIKPLQVFILYPSLILMVTMMAVILSLGQIRKTHVWEINNQE